MFRSRSYDDGAIRVGAKDIVDLVQFLQAEYGEEEDDKLHASGKKIKEAVNLLFRDDPALSSALSNLHEALGRRKPSMFKRFLRILGRS